MEPTSTPPESQPFPGPTPPAKPGNLKLPLLLNVGLMLLLALFAQAAAGSNEGEAALILFFLLVGQFLLNGAAVLVALLLGRKEWVRGFLLGGLLVFLVGLGTCGYTLEHLHIDTR